MDATKAAMILLAVVLLHAQMSSSQPPSVEPPAPYCGPLVVGGEWGQCDPGSCCSGSGYCGTGYHYCSVDYCVLYCPFFPPPPNEMTEEEEETRGGGGVEVLARRLDNATIDQYYLDRKIITDHHDVVVDRHIAKAAATVAAATSASLSSSSVTTTISCGPFLLSRLPLAARRRYPWAALGVPSSSSRNNVTDGAICGQCLKVTHAGAGGARARQVMVRVVHIPNIEGIALDTNTFRRLGGDDGRESRGYNDLVVKYQFENC
ncbi:unnamed protein product [Linum trigynum]|uniref:Barwin domain-containing protein n=1 Tax=Linum trigynum TaxID=586398 RepID=A0AAV2D4R3_9ROSI